MAVPAVAGVDEDAEHSLIAAVEAKYADVAAMEADFVQVTRSSAFGEEEAKGDLVIKRPSKMRWNFDGGDAKQFVTDGTTMWIYTEADNQVIRYSDVSAQASAADSVLGSLDKLDELFTVELVQNKDGAHVVDLTPKEQKQLKAMQLTLNQDLVVQRVVITDAFDNVTDLAFSDVKLNTDVPDSTFEFQVPAGAEVIDATPPR